MRRCGAGRCAASSSNCRCSARNFLCREGGAAARGDGAAEQVTQIYRLPVAVGAGKSGGVARRAQNTPGETTCYRAAANPRPHRANLLGPFRRQSGSSAMAMAAGGSRSRPSRADRRAITVPGDPSSAAFPLGRRADRAGFRRNDGNVGLNPTACRPDRQLREMGADITLQNQRTEGRRAVADLQSAPDC